MSSQPCERNYQASPSGGNALVDKLARHARFETRDIDALRSLSRNRKCLAAHEVIVHEGSKPCFAFAIMSGVAYRYKHLADGRRQIFGYLLPGDLCDTHFILANRADHSIGLLTKAEIATFPTQELMLAMVDHPQIERSLRQVAMLEESILREWLLNIGQRGAVQKLAHFLCEISARLDSVGMIQPDGSFSISLTQIELADTMGLTAVHVNRCLQQLRQTGMLKWNRGGLSIVDRARLIEFAEFDEQYLQLPRATVALPLPLVESTVWPLPANGNSIAAYA